MKKNKLALALALAFSFSPVRAAQPERAPMARIIMDARSYGDSIVLRWAGEDWATQQALYHVGVDIYRTEYSDNGISVDTLVKAFKPWTKEQLVRCYSARDSIANIAIALLYGGKELKPDQTQSAKGTAGAWLELSENQKQHIMFAVLVSEWRKDVADRIAMRWVDKKVKANCRYEYAIVPSYFDETGTLQIASASRQIENLPFKRPDFNVTIGDSITGQNQVYLWWENRHYSSYEIERRKRGETQWKRLTEIPYLQMSADNGSDEVQDCHYADVVDDIGVYEYRVFAHDPFGELTNASPVHIVKVPDMQAPKAPDLVKVEIDRQDPNDLSKKVMATFHFEKDSIEADFVGFMPMYYNQRNTNKQWKELSPKLLPPGTTTYTCDMTGLSTGMVVVAAYDSAHNVSYSIPRMIQIRDVKAPSMMKNFKAEVNPDNGTIRLTWEPDSVDDDIDYYEVLSANDTTHTFIVAHQKGLKECQFVDTVAMDVNQKYIYYKVRATDYSTNRGEDTPPLQVLRPTNLLPHVAHLLKSTVDSLGIHTTWACSNEQMMDHHVLMRRLEGTQVWDTLGVFNADSVKAAGNIVRFDDCPATNRKHDYQYAMESFNCWGKSSGLSLILSIAFEGSRYVNIPMRLSGSYDEKTREMVFSWVLNNGKPINDPCYICFYRKGPNDKEARFFISEELTEKDFRLKRSVVGHTEEIYIKLRFEDGRESQISNTVSITVPQQNN